MGRTTEQLQHRHTVARSRIMYFLMFCVMSAWLASCSADVAAGTSELGQALRNNGQQIDLSWHDAGLDLPQVDVTILQFHHKFAWFVLLFLPIVLGVLLALVALGYGYLRIARAELARSLAEQAASNQNAMLQVVIDTLPHPLSIKAHGGQLLAVNREYERLSHQGRDQLLGKIETLPFSTAWMEKLDRVARDVMVSGHAFQEEMPYTDAQGKPSVASISLVPVMPQSKPDVIAIVALLIDKGELQRACAQVDAATQRLHELSDALDVVLCQLHLTLAGMLLFQFVSENAPVLFGLSAQAMTEDERPATASLLAEDREQFAAAVMASAERLQAIQVRCRADNAGQALWLCGHLVPHREPDGSTIWNGYWHKMAAQRESGAQDMDEAANAAVRAKDEFLAMMSHEIRTPMNGVMGLAEVLEGTPLSNDQADLVALMRDSAGTMLAILDDILDYSKIEAGHLSLSYTAVDLRRLCDQALGLLSPKAQEKRLQLHVQVDAGLAGTHLVDGTRLRQILFNLLSNAIKFTTRGSVVLRLHVEQDDGAHQSLRITVEDTGKGISKEQLTRLFEPFIQEDSSISRRFGGTGLGLSICRRLANLMHGEISIDSVENVGSTAQLKLTLAIVERDSTHRALHGARVRLLLADDNLRQTVQMYLHALGMQVVEDGDPADLKIALVAQQEKIELSWIGSDGRAARALQLNANPLQWGMLRQACLMLVQTDVKDQSGSPMTAVDMPRRRGERLLVAEDNATNQEVMRRFLHRLNFDCDVVSNGREAFEALKNHGYALLLTDCHMPEMDGYTLVRHVREIEQQQGLTRMPVIGLTASTRSEDERIAMRVGMDVCLVKPTGFTALADCLDRFLPQTEQGGERETDQERIAAFGKIILPGADPITSLQLKYLESELGEEGKMTVLRIFRDSLKDDLSRMPRYGDAAMSAWLHRVKGAIAVMQFDTLMQAIDALALTVEAAQEREHGRMRRSFISLCERSLAQIDQLFAGDREK